MRANFRILILLGCSVLSSSCIRARLLNPPGSGATTTTLSQTIPDTFSSGSGTLVGNGVMLQARFGLSTPNLLTGTGVTLKVGN
jgi:hypothetical protein